VVAVLVETYYRAQKTAHALVAGAFMELVHQLVKPARSPTPAERESLQRRFRALIQADIEHVRRGDYPERLLFQLGLRDTLRALPEGVLELPRVILRARRQGYDDIPALDHPERYPRYYRRTFHWQSDGWFSKRSAKMYDPGVDLLFGGTADVMRRMILPDLAAFLRPLESPRVLDVACGTGRFLGQLSETVPDARLYGLDLSAPYLEHARQRLAHIEGLALVAENAEAVPFADGAFDALSSIFLFHELPSDARRNVFREAFRVLRPGGMFAVLDSSQLDDSPDVAYYLTRFPRLYHEPYYRGYLSDPLPALAREAGFEVVADRPHFLSRAVIAKKPGGAAAP
jgi:ubiquinone/menaquinone biosynthesis C-methylase UbiE